MTKTMEVIARESMQNQIWCDAYLQHAKATCNHACGEACNLKARHHQGCNTLGMPTTPNHV